MNPRSQRSWDAFHVNVEAQGGTVTEPTWRGANEPHSVRCVDGHPCSPTPANIQRGQRICHDCSYIIRHAKRSAAAEADFRARIETSGHTFVGPYNGTHEPCLVICGNCGENRSPHPSSIQQGQGVCAPCGHIAGGAKKSALAEAAFRATLEKGSHVFIGPYQGANEPCHVICGKCKKGCSPHPSHIQEGTGVCRFCSGSSWDVGYVVVNEDLRVLKFGVTSNDPRPRLQVHARSGFVTVVRVASVEDARNLETALKHAMRDAGIAPVRGREYFPAIAIATVLDVFDGWTR